jgi:HK97 family phage major capsid protein
MNLQEMKRKRAELIANMRKLLDACEGRSDKKFTDDESRQYQGMETELADLVVRIEREEKLAAAEQSARTQDPANQDRNANQDSEFRTLGDFLQCCRFNPGDSRLVGVDSRSEKRDLQLTSGTGMGYVVPPQFDSQIRMIEPQAAIIRPRATVIPAGDSPEAAYKFLTLDQSGSRGVYSGVSIKWINEGGTRQDAGDAKAKMVELKPEEASGYMDVSDRLLNNSAAVGPFVQNLLRAAIIGAEEDAFYTGDGVGKPHGIKGHACVKTVSRNTASSVKWADIKSMFGAFMFGGSPVWIMNQQCLPQIMSLEDTNGNALWMPNAALGPGGMLCGLPLLINDQNPALGTEGDLALVDLRYYFIKDGTGLTIFMDPYTQKANGVTRIYVIWSVDGQPMLSSPLTQRNGTTTVSPFVLLK